MWCSANTRIITTASIRKAFSTRISGRYFCNPLCGGWGAVGGGGAGVGGMGNPKAAGANCGAAPAGGGGGIGGSLGAPGGVHAGALGGAAAGAGGPAAPWLCKSRKAEPEITRVNSPGPLDGG